VVNEIATLGIENEEAGAKTCDATLAGRIVRNAKKYNRLSKILV
jgi:hypothetical protein